MLDVTEGSKYPMPEHFYGQFMEWLERQMKENEWPVGERLSGELARIRSEENVRPSEYIFKTYTDADVTLLEENRDPIGKNSGLFQSTI